MSLSRARQIRVDIPKPSGLVQYFFIFPEEMGHPWWDGVIGHLLNLTPTQTSGQDARGQPIQMVLLTGPARREFLALLQTAPREVVADHRTLRSALRWLPESDRDIPVEYFGWVVGEAEDQGA